MLMNLRNALMAGKRLPYDAEVEYLESTSSRNAYFNTGIDASSDIRAVGRFRWLSGSVGKDRYIIAQTGSTRMYFGTYVSKWMFGFRDFSKPASPLPQENVDYEFDVRWYSERPELFINGESIIAYGSETGISDNGQMQIFCRQNNPAAWSAHARIYYCKIWQNGVLVRDFIPVRKGTVGYLYDRVSGKLFGNAGTGDFVLGPDVVPVEYLRGDGNAYINTGVPCAFTDTYKVVAGYNENTRQSSLFGVAWAKSSVFMQMNTSPKDFYWHGMNPSSYHQFADGMNTIICGNGYITINGVTTTGSNYLNANEGEEIYLLSNRSYGSTGPAKARVSSFTITSQGGDDKLRLLSVRVGTEGAMMDVLTRRIYRNAGTGAFTYGNDLKYPIPAA